MAESLRDSPDSATSEKGKTVDQVPREGFPCIPECAVCLQTCVHPARLPCNHIFCFLCLKGLATQGRRCAMCRQDIPADYLDHPELLEYPPLSEKDPQAYKWFYEGRNGWWQYEERASEEIEAHFSLGRTSCELLICGTLYVVDFAQNLQYSKKDPHRKRRIKRDTVVAPHKGVAGIV